MRADGAFTKPEVYECLEDEGFGCAIRLLANEILMRHIDHLLTRPVERPPQRPLYQAASWQRPRRVVAEVEWRYGQLFPRVSFVVTDLTAAPQAVVEFYNRRDTVEQWNKEGKYALHWTRLLCHRFVANQVRLALFALATTWVISCGDWLCRAAYVTGHCVASRLS